MAKTAEAGQHSGTAFGVALSATGRILACGLNHVRDFGLNQFKVMSETSDISDVFENVNEGNFLLSVLKFVISAPS
ncbi:MAG: hypothetical protein ACLQB4_00880 [Beijerinckiaceae bacterium]